MSRLAPGRRLDMAELLRRKAATPKYTPMWNKICLKIEDLLEEGQDPKMHSLRQRLLNASIANDEPEITKIAEEIHHYVQYHRRDKRWLRKEY